MSYNNNNNKYLHVHIFRIFQVVFSLCIYSYSELTYNRIYTYPKWAIGLGWMLACSSVIMIPLTMTFKILTTPGSLYDVSTILNEDYYKIIKVHLH